MLEKKTFVISLKGVSLNKVLNLMLKHYNSLSK